MKILIINKYLFPKGGADISALRTGRLLNSKKHKVIFWGMDHPLNLEFSYRNNFVSYVDFNDPGKINKQIKMAINLIYSIEAKKKIEKVIVKEKPDIVHLNNFAHQISPSILHVLKRFSIPAVMTMHDYKMVCPTYQLLLNGKLCEKCKNGKYYQCFINKCTKNNRLKSIINMLEMYLHHKILNIYDLIDIYISPSLFLKEKLEEMGFRKRIVYLPNFINVKEYFPKYYPEENSIVYFGRLSYEKGLFTLIEAVKNINNVNLKIIGEGPIKKSLEFEVKKWQMEIKSNINFLGYKTGDDLKNEIRKSLFVIFPSECYENNPLSIIEAYASGKPVIGSRIGGILELIKDKETGLYFEPGNSEDLKSKMEYLINNPNKIIEMGRMARAFVKKEFNKEKHYKKLMGIYNKAIASKKKNKKGIK
ncbi:MAG: glycosyltransferase family 4 protein [Candidatus Helarchaeota archaeon]